MRSERILIVGGGVAGLATAWSLAGRGARDIVLVERESALATHSSRKNAAILRTATDDERVEELARRGGEFLRNPPSGFSDRPLLDACGVLIAVGKRSSEPPAWEQRALADGRAQEIDRARLSSTAPHFAAGDLRCAWFPTEGRIDIDALLVGFERGARAAGVEIETVAGVTALLRTATAVTGARLSDGRELRAEKTLIAAGGWAGGLAVAAGSRVRLRPTRRHLVVTEPDPRVDPRWPVVWAESDGFYARPEAGGWMLCPCDEADAEPDSIEVVAAVRDLTLAKSRRWLPGFALPRVARCWSGVRTMTSDGRFAIGADPDVPGLYWAAGLGGHGMLCAPVVGEIAAARLLDEPVVDAAAASCDPARLASGREPRIVSPLPVPEVHPAPLPHGVRTADREPSEDPKNFPA
jgi:glycine/D-amino acid oxidase-like deaminating enzyme